MPQQQVPAILEWWGGCCCTCEHVNRQNEEFLSFVFGVQTGVQTLQEAGAADDEHASASPGHACIQGGSGEPITCRRLSIIRGWAKGPDGQLVQPSVRASSTQVVEILLISWKCRQRSLNASSCNSYHPWKKHLTGLSRYQMIGSPQVGLNMFKAEADAAAALAGTCACRACHGSRLFAHPMHAHGTPQHKLGQPQIQVRVARLQQALRVDGADLPFDPGTPHPTFTVQESHMNGRTTPTVQNVQPPKSWKPHIRTCGTCLCCDYLEPKRTDGMLGMSCNTTFA